MDTITINQAAQIQLKEICDPTTLHMLQKYGPCMTYDDLAGALQLKVGTIRNSLSNADAEHKTPWVKVVRKARVPFSAKSVRFRTVDIASLFLVAGEATCNEK